MIQNIFKIKYKSEFDRDSQFPNKWMEHTIVNGKFKFGRYGLYCNKCPNIAISNLTVSPIECTKPKFYKSNYLIASPGTSKWSDAMNSFSPKSKYSIISSPYFHALWKYEVPSLWTRSKAIIYLSNTPIVPVKQIYDPWTYLLPNTDEIVCTVLCSASVEFFN